ncbi:MAG: SLATT domain-containing protein [Deltaproteobacteria bacterium]|nr:SLATT domain-containing protein [Deltaproteobacteria bacterium]
MEAETDRIIVPNGDGWTTEAERLLEEWRKRVYAAQSAYYIMAERLRRQHYYYLGIPTVILSSIVGTTIFADIGQDKLSIPVRLIAGTVSILAAVLAGLQTFLRPGQAATEHGFAADWFAAIRREIEELLALPRASRGNAKACLDSIRREMNKAGQKAPELDESLWISVARRFGVSEPPPTNSGGVRGLSSAPLGLEVKAAARAKSSRIR